MLKVYLHTEGKMHNYCDSSQLSSHPLFKTFPPALQIQLYFDDLETTNPLGSTTKNHKMGAVYFALRNLPPEYNLSLSNIHLCLLFNSMDREYGFGKILEPLLEDIRLFESSGIQVEMQGQNHTLYGTICVLTADNLAIHSLCGYVESFSANKFCHFCMVDKTVAQSVYDEDKLEKRTTRENYQQHVRFNDPSSTGVKEDSCLNKLQYFHVTEKTCVDIMHDILEDVAPLEVRLMLHHFIYQQKLFTLEL